MVNQIMKESFPSIVDEHFTANMESLLDSIGEGAVNWKTVVRNFYPDLEAAVEVAEKELQKVKIEDEVTDVVCDQCGRNMVVKYGPHGKFLACPGFPECKNTKTLQQETPGSCPRCGKKVLAKKSKTGRTYYGCEDNPKCGFMTWDIPLAEKCPQCGSSLFKTTGRVKMIHCLKEGCGYEKSAK